MYNNYRPITTVQYRWIVDGHVVGMVRCDWPFTAGYIINTIHMFAKVIFTKRFYINKLLALNKL